jgi:hypothetical protein
MAVVSGLVPKIAPWGNTVFFCANSENENNRTNNKKDTFIVYMLA